MKLHHWCILLLCIHVFNTLDAQTVLRGDFCFLWYNVENLFHPDNDSLEADDEFTPEGSRHWNWSRYRIKLTSLARVIIAAGGGEPPEMVGLCEIENARVLEDLCKHPILAPYHYTYLHRDGPDHRGMDLACLFRSEKVVIFQWEYIPFGPPLSATREIMHMCFGLGGDTLDLFQIHLVSKYGGAGASAELRRTQAAYLLHCMDSVSDKRCMAFLMAAGDFNENLDAYSMEPLRNDQSGKIELIPLKVSGGGGSYKYRGRWSFIDQVLLSGNMQQYDPKACILSLAPLLTEDLKYGGQKPRRCYEAYQYQGGISDHLPLVVHLYRSHSSASGGR